jgi:hypothetical protein
MKISMNGQIHPTRTLKSSFAKACVRPTTTKRAYQSGFRKIDACVRDPLESAILMESRSIAADHLDNRTSHNIAVLDVYVNSIDVETSTVLKILHNLLKQVVGRLDPIPAHICQMYEFFAPTASTPSHVTLLENLKKCLNSFEMVYILLDAFDECSDRHMMIKIVQDLVKLSSAKVLLTSRYAEPASLRNSPLMRCIHVSASKDDIRTFLCTKLDVEPNLSQDLRDEILEKIPEQADGM